MEKTIRLLGLPKFNLQIQDLNNYVEGEQEPKLSLVQVSCEIPHPHTWPPEPRIERAIIRLTFQTTNTFDAAAVSSELELNRDDEDYDDAKKAFSDRSIGTIKKYAQRLYNEYIEKTYVRNTDHFGGIDANSEINELKRR